MTNVLQHLWPRLLSLFGMDVRARQLRRWCRAMDKGSQYPITLSNVAYDINGVVPRAPKAVGKTVIGRMIDRWATMTAADGGTAADVLSITLNAAEEDLFCRGPAATVDGLVSRIVDWGSLQQFYLLNASRAELVRPHVPGRSRPEFALAASRIKNVTVRGERPHAWITRTASVEEAEREVINDHDPDRLARRIRDYLGLDHYTDHQLFEMRYPERALHSARVAAPTFIEGACREVYRSKAGADGWGRAVDIGSPNLDDGAPEAVHVPIPFTARFTLRYLGAVHAAGTSDHAQLHGACPHRWHERDLRMLERYLR